MLGNNGPLPRPIMKSPAYVAAIGSLNIISSIAARVTHWPMTMTFLPESFMLSSPDKILGFRARYRL